MNAEPQRTRSQRVVSGPKKNASARESRRLKTVEVITHLGPEVGAGRGGLIAREDFAVADEDRSRGDFIGRDAVDPDEVIRVTAPSSPVGVEGVLDLLLVVEKDGAPADSSLFRRVAE